MALPFPASTKQFEWPSNAGSRGLPSIARTTFPARISAWKWATDPAFDVWRSVASPMAKILSCFFDRSVWGSVGRKRNSLPRPYRSIISEPIFVGTVTRRS